MHNIFKTNTSPLIIAGPCSIESETQLRQIATLLPSEKVQWIRGGVWKPRTRPGGFEGYGEQALQWIAQVKHTLPNVRFCCEVAHPEHVELCLKYGIDGLWIGSRTVGNPFSINEICSALKGTELPILVKNPMNPDVKLWIGAIERVMQAGIRSIAAVHRGFSLFNNMGYRNAPLWEIPIELRRLVPDHPIICAPSHIGGRRELIPNLMQTAIDLHFDGLMVEVHPSPNEALTDNEQQLTPTEFITLLSQLRIHQHEGSKPTELKLLRQQIDIIDKQLMDCLTQRFNISRQIAQVKKENNMAVFQPKRWEEVLERKLTLAREQGLNPEFIKEIYEKIHAESVKVQIDDKQ